MPKGKHIHPEHVHVRRSAAGLGLFAARDFKRGERIIEYVGERVLSSNDRNNLYIFRVNSRWDIDGSPRWNTARYANHSCKPNCEAVNDNGKIFICARRKVSVGEEITYDYGEEYFEEYIAKKGCRCAKCSS